MQQRCIGIGGQERIDQCRERFDVDHDRLGGVDGGGPRLGHDGDDGLAHESDPVGGQDRSAHLLFDQGDGLDRWQVDVGCRHHRQHTRCGDRPGPIDRGDQAVRHGGAHVHHMGDVIDADVIDVGAPCGQQGGVLDPLDPMSEDAHGRPMVGGPGR